MGAHAGAALARAESVCRKEGGLVVMPPVCLFGAWVAIVYGVRLWEKTMD